VTVEGNKHFDQANIRRSLPAVREGATPNTREIARDAQLLGENPSKRATVLLRAGQNDGEMDAVIRVQDEKTWRAAVTFDNTGSPTTGNYRLGLGFQEANLFNLDHVVTVQYQLDPEPLRDADELKILGIGYHIPLYGLNSSLDLLFGYSDLGAAARGQVIEGLPFNISGSGTLAGIRYNYVLPRPQFIDEYEHKITFGADYKAFSNQVRPVLGGVPGTNLTPDVTVYPFSLTYSGTKRMENAEWTFFGSVAKNFFPHGNDATSEVFNGPEGVRPGVGEPHYTVWRYGVSYARALPRDFQLRSNLTGQWTRDALIPGEQFGIGGWDSLRGMYEREGASDRGYRASVELYSPDVASHFGLDGGRLRFLTFFDVGKVTLTHRDASEPCGPTGCGFSAASVGFGMRMSLRHGVVMRLDYGHLLDGGVSNQSGEDRWHFGIGVVF
jgi:hemolysin activation/secretion protein